MSSEVLDQDLIKPTSKQDSSSNLEQNFQELASEEVKEEVKEPEVSYDALIVTLKEKNKELKKLENFKKKIEDRYKEKVKQLKETVSDKQVFEDFIKSVLPNVKTYDKSSKQLIVDSEQLIKLHKESYSKSQLSSQENKLREENEAFKKKINDLNQQIKTEQLRYQQVMQQNNKLLNDPLQSKLNEYEQQIKGLGDLLQEKDQEIESLKLIQVEYQQIKGKQLLQAIKAGKTSSEQNYQQSNDKEEEIQHLKQQLSEKTNRILELNEKLLLQTADTTDKPQEIKSSPEKEEEQQHLSNILHHSSLENVENEIHLEDEELMILKQRVAELEQIRVELLDQLEQNKQKARSMLMNKDIQIQKIKLMLYKVESYLKQSVGMSQDQINKVVNFKEDELIKMQQQEKELEDHFSRNGILEHFEKSNNTLQKRNADSKGPNDQDSKIVEYIRNVFVKYLEYLAQNNTKEITTIEHVLFTELQVTRDQAQRLEHLRKKNTFWKKIIPFQGLNQPVIKNKFSAGELKKKLFGNFTQSNQLLEQPNNHSRPSIGGGSSSIDFNKSLTTPFQTQLNSTIDVDTNHHEFLFTDRPGFRLASDSGLSPKRLEEVKFNKFPTQKHS